ncbi:MAG: S-layer homology domain-containing protein [Lachnospiraceae bacterium]|nr:S-layer homology domain-containing protein [Lachnospiraceae bacterium]
MKQTLKRLLSLVLVAALFTSIVPTQAFAAEQGEVYLPQIAIGNDILDYDVFYLATASASIEENSRLVYLLKVGRGGPADSESSVLVKIADMTAKYGEDYIVRVRDERTKVENPEGNFSLMELMEGSDFEQNAISDSDEFADMLESDPEAQAAYQEGVETALEFLDEASGLSEKYGGENPYAEAVEELYGESAEPSEDEEPADDAEPVEDAEPAEDAESTEDTESAEDTEPVEAATEETAPDDAYTIDADVEAVIDWDEGAIPAIENGEVITIGGTENEYENVDPVQAAANLFTGENATAQRLTTEGDMFQDLQAIANVMTNAVVGASVELTFDIGETEKYLEIVPKDNHKGDGNRMFYIILGAPSGTTTNSSASSCAFTIVDDEEQEPAVVSFSDAEYSADGESVTVTVNREGAMNSVVSAIVKTTGEGTAEMGRDYSQVDATLVFPFGVDHLSVTIPVRKEYLSGEGSFGLELVPDAGCELGEISTATVYIGGMYTDKASLMMAAAPKLAAVNSAPLLGASGGSNTMVRNTLATYRTLDAIDLSKPLDSGAYRAGVYSRSDSGFTGWNYWNGSAFHMKWKGSYNGYVYNQFEMSDYWTSYYLAGAEVSWSNGYVCGSDKATMKIAIAGKGIYGEYQFNVYNDPINQNGTDKNGNYVYWYPYDSNRVFGSETRYIYPHINAIDPDKQAGYDQGDNRWRPYYNGDHPQAIEIMNISSCNDCCDLYLSSIKPILRPFQVNIINSDGLTYLKADGTRSSVSSASTADAEIKDAGSQAVFFMDDTFTVRTTSGSDAAQYGYLSALKLLDGGGSGKSIATLAANDDPSNTSISYTLNTENMQALINQINPKGLLYYATVGCSDAWFKLLRENPYATRTDGYATYVQYNIMPEFSYIDTSVTLRNPYQFPVTFTISGTDYTLAAGETREIKAPDGENFHKGDDLAVTKITLGSAAASGYTTLGVKYQAKYQSTSATWDKEGTWNFIDFDTIHISGTQDNRLNYSEIIIEPNLQISNNTIRVRVKTGDLQYFITEDVKDANGNVTQGAGLLGTAGAVDGEYTYFTFADKTRTVNGKLYAVTATPKDSGMVCVWYDANTLKYYEGNTLYFTAGAEPDRNIITLTAETATRNIRIQGTLKYNNYNIRTGAEGNASNVPASGAVLAAGSAGGVANASGYVSAGPIAVTGKTDRYMRYIVSVNGNDVLKEALLIYSTDAAEPTMLWDFNSNEAMSASMGGKKARISYAGGTDGTNDYYAFTATGSDPYVSIDNAAASSVDNIQWVKVRAKNLSGSDSIELFACINNNSNVSGNTCTHIDLEQDTDWHEYIINIPAENVKTANTYKGANLKSTAWNGKINWIRLDPMENNSSDNAVGSGDQILIDYVAFFPDEDSAKAYRNEDAVVDGILDISANFPKGVSPVSSAIFSDIQITGEITNANGAVDSAYQISSDIPVVEGMTAKMTVRIKPQDYLYNTGTGSDGTTISDTETENPVSVQFVVYDSNDVFRGVYDAVDTYEYEPRTKYFKFTVPIEFIPGGEEEIELEDGSTMTVEYTSLMPEPGDKLYIRLVTDRLAQATDQRTADDLAIDNYQYSDVFTGMYFYQPVSYAGNVPMGITTPIQIEYGNLPLIGNTGMDLAFPFVSVGIMKISHGYRIYIGFSPMQIVDTVKGTHITQMSGSDGQYWKSLFSIAHPFDSFAGGIGEAQQQISEFKESAKDAAAKGEKFDKGSMGSPSWKFDFSVGMYFDFLYVTVTQQNGMEFTDFILNGMGGYVSVTLGFSMAWYFVMPVVFLPVYIGIELQGTVMGYLGANFNKDVVITYDDSLNGGADINDGINSLNGGIRGYGYVQLSAGIGLCGTLGVRGVGKVNMIASWEPEDPHGSGGFYVSLHAGFIIDLFLFSVPLVFQFANWPFGSFEYYANPEKWTSTPDNPNPQLASTFSLRSGSGEDSMWLGDQMMVQGAFRPNKDKVQILAADAYERPDSKLITLSDGESLALAFIDSDNAKGDSQRTTLKLATYHEGQWSQPVVVSGDNTADFQPSIAETKDGKLLVAWVSPTKTDVDLSTDEGVMQYLNSMEVYAAFVALDGNKQINTKTDSVYGICADTEVTRISNDKRVNSSGNVGYYDSHPTVVTDLESGDAMVYYIKSGRSALGDGDITDYINPYTNDCVVCYMPFNAEADTDTDGRTVPAGWLFDNFYYSEMHGNTTNEQFLIDNFGGQRFLDGAVNANNERYTIPDFTAIAYNGLAVYAYTVDTDGSNDTDADKELYLQVYDFRNHETKYKIQLTRDSVSDTLPQFFRSKINAADGMSTDAENTHTKLFWYRDGKQVVYIDVTELLRDGINADGSLKTTGSYTVNGVTHNKYTEPHSVWYVSEGDSHASLSGADFRAVEDSKGNLYVLWTEGVTDEDGNTAQEIFGTGLVEYTVTDQEGNTSAATSGWSKPYQITRDGFQNDEIAVAMSGENLVVVHNRFTEELAIPDEDAEHNGQVDFTPIQISDMCLVADTLEPCGSVETESIALYDQETGDALTLPISGEKVNALVTVSNNGMNVAEGYKISLYANDTLVGEQEVTDALVPNSGAVYTFEYTLPANVDGLVFKAVTQEMKDASSKIYYRNTDTFCADPLEAKAAYEITDTRTYQAADGFRASFTVTNTGNAASSADDTLNIALRGPANLADTYTEILYNSKISLAIGESKDFDVPVAITPEMMEPYSFVTTLITVQKEVVEQTIGTTEYKGTRYLSNLEYADFDLVQPMNMELQDVTVAANETAAITFSMDLGDVFRGNDDTVTYAVDDLNIAQISGSKVLGVAEGTTKLYATHASTGATTEATVTVTPATDEPDEPVTPYVPDDSSDDNTITVKVSGDEGSVTVSATVSGNTATITAPTDAQIAEITDRAGETGAVTIDLSSLPENITAVSIPAKTVKAIDEAMEEDGEGLTIKLPNSTVTFDAAALASIVEQTTGNDLQLSVDPITETRLNNAQKEAVADLDVQAVYDIYLTSGGKRITDFGGGKATVEVTHKVKDGQQPAGFSVWYVAEDGATEKNPTTATKNAVKFVVTHFSDYVVAYDEKDASSAASCDRGDTCPMSAFDDLDKTSWYHDGVHWALANEIMNGYGGGKFGPNDTTSRAMIVTMLHRFEDEPTVDYDMDFTDVEDGKWYTEAIRWAAANGIVNGYGDGRFGPNDELTREQLATILYRYAKLKGQGFTGTWAFPLTFDDASVVSDWAYEAMCWMTMNGVINGVGDNKLSPKGSATRAQVATMLMRFEAIEQ